MVKKLIAAFGFIVILFVGAIGGEIGEQLGKSAFKPSQKEIEAKLIEGFIEAANQYNKSLPMMLDENTQLDNISVGPGPRAVYHHTLLKYKFIYDENFFRTTLRPEVVRKVCNSFDMKESLQYGGIYVYAYYKTNGVEVARFEVDKSDCKF